MKKLFVMLMAIVLLTTIDAYATTHNSSVNLDISVNADGYAIGGGTTKRTLTITGADSQLNATQVILGTNTFTMPGASATIAGLGTAETWTAAQTFTNADLLLKGTSTGATTLESGLTSSGSNTLTLPITATDTLAGLGTVQTYTAAQTFTNSDLILLGSSTGTTIFTSDNSSGTTYTMHVPAANDTLVDLVGSQSLTHKTLTDSTNVLGRVTMTLGSDADYDMHYRDATTGYLTRLANGTTGQVLTATTGGAPSWASPVPLTFTEVTAASATAAVNNGYIANYATLCTITLPTTIAVGQMVSVVGKGAGGWQIAQSTNQLIHFGSAVTTTGTGGYLASTNAYDSIDLICTVANTTFTVRSSQGNITYN
jgi:hypothetical protein